MDKTTPRLINCFQSVFPQLPEGDISTASQASVSSWDSVAALNLIAVIEDEFGVQLDYEQLEHLNSFAAIAAYLSENAT